MFHQLSLQHQMMLQQFYGPLVWPPMPAYSWPLYPSPALTPPFSPLSPISASPQNTIELPANARALEAMTVAQFRRLYGSEPGKDFLLSKLAESDEYRTALLNQALKPRVFAELAKHYMGNYLAQELLTIAGDRLSVICEQLQGEWVSLAFHKFGTRIVQRALEVCTLEQVFAIAECFRGIEVVTAKNEYACHVVQKLVAGHSLEVFLHFADAIAVPDVLMEVTSHKFGCHVVLVMISRLAHIRSMEPDGVVTNVRRMLDRLALPLVHSCCELAVLEYGNFIVQYLVKCRDAPELRYMTFRRCVLGRVLEFSQSKFGSHVMEKAIGSASEDEFNAICRELLEGYESTLDGREAMDIITMDIFGNYVVQTLLTVCFEMHIGIRDGTARYLPQLENKIRAMQPRLMRYSAGKKIIELLDQLQQPAAQPPPKALQLVHQDPWAQTIHQANPTDSNEWVTF